MVPRVITWYEDPFRKPLTDEKYESPYAQKRKTGPEVRCNLVLSWIDILLSLPSESSKQILKIQMQNSKSIQNNVF